MVRSDMEATPLKELVRNMVEDGVFNRADLVPRYLAVGESCGDNDYGWDLYLKMMRIVTKGREDSEVRRGLFSDLFSKARAGELDTKTYPLVFKSDTWRMSDGARHRRTCADD